MAIDLLTAAFDDKQYSETKELCAFSWTFLSNLPFAFIKIVYTQEMNFFSCDKCYIVEKFLPPIIIGAISTNATSDVFSLLCPHPFHYI